MKLTHDNDCAYRFGHDCTCETALAGGACRAMTEQELDALVRDLGVRGMQDREMSNHYVRRMEIERRSASNAIATLRAQLAEARAEIARLTDLNSTAYIDGHDAAKNEYRDEIQRLEVLNAQLTVMVGEDAVEQIEAAVAAQIEADAGICHALYRRALKDSDDDLSSPWKSHKASAYGTALQAIRNQPHDRTALDAAIRAAKVAGLGAAADAIWHGPIWEYGGKADGVSLMAAHACRDAILALIEREARALIAKEGGE